MGYYRKPILYADGEKGMALQVWAIAVGDNPENAVPTGITIQSRRKTRKHQFVDTVLLDDVPYPSIRTAITAYELKTGKTDD
jgi:hypothetical protein